MAPNSWSFEKFLFDPLAAEGVLLDDSSHPDKQFHNNSGNFYNTLCFSPNYAKDFLKRSKNHNFCILYLKGATKSLRKIVFVSTTTIGENTTNVLNCYFLN